MDSKIDFDGLGRELLSNSLSYVSSWLPGGKLHGKEYSCGSLQGEPGKSLKVNIISGQWSDFARGEKGGDLISLFAAIHGIGQGEAARQLKEQLGHPIDVAPKVSKLKEETTFRIGQPPASATPPSFLVYKLGKAIATWTYVNSLGEPLFHISRHEDESGKKQIIPWSWDLEKRAWVNRAYPEPRPLYNLAEIVNRPNDPVLIVEGEKAAEAARSFVSAYVVTTWPNGSNSHGKTDWEPLKGRKVLIWPDADKSGIQAAEAIAARLFTLCKHVKVLGIDITRKENIEGYDAFDFLVENPEDTWIKFREWATPIAKLYEPRKAELAVQEQPPIEAYNEDAEPSFSGNQVSLQAQNMQVNIQKTNGKEVPVAGSHYALWESIGLPIQRNGQVPATLRNALTVLEKLPEFKEWVWFDEFHQKIFRKDDQKGKREWSETDKLRLTVKFQGDLGLQKFEDRICDKALHIFAHQNVRNEPRDWMETLVWDGKTRLDSFCFDYFGCEDTDYSRAVAKNFWISMVARIYQPGCKVDNMLILEGPQAMHKSTVFKIIGDEWYSIPGHGVGEKDFIVGIQGKMIVELAELDNFQKSDSNLIKRVISTEIDRHCFKYEAYSKDLPRRCIFVGTTNEDNYLRDVTGGRRFWPIEVTREIDRETLKSNRSQLFAEAVVRFKKGETWWELPNDEAAEQQEKRRQSDVWEDEIYTFLVGKTDVTSKEIAKEVLKIEVSKIDRKIENRIGLCLRALGWKRHTIRRFIHGQSKVVKAWVPTDFNQRTQLEIEFQ